MSPHLEIYTFKQNMATSVLFRGTGIVMTAGACVGAREFVGGSKMPPRAPPPSPRTRTAAGLGSLAIAGLFSSKPYKHHLHTLQSYPLLNGIVKFGVAFPLAYHFAGGLRHLAWDNLVGHNTKAIVSSGRVAVGVAAAIGVVAAVTEFQ